MEIKRVESYPKRIELNGILQHPENDTWEVDDYPVSSAMGCFAEENSSNIHERYAVKGELYKSGKKELTWNQAQELIMKETSGRGHGAVLDKAIFNWSIDNLTRASTLFLCSPQYLWHLQQSLRRANAKRGFEELIGDEEMGKRGFSQISAKNGNKIMEEQFELYNKMCGAGVDTEDARIILPLHTKTTIDTGGNAREMMHLKSMVDRMNVTSEVRDTVYTMYEQAREFAPRTMEEREKNFEVLAWMPSSQLYARQNMPMDNKIREREKIKQLTGNNNFCIGYSIGLQMSEKEIEQAVLQRDEALLANLKSTHFTFMVPMSLMSFHQAARQRTWDQSVETLESAVRRGSFTVPPKIKAAGYEKELLDLAEESRKYVLNNLDKNPDVFGVVPHCLEVYDLIHVNGWNALHSIGKRRCKTAQWDIRSKAVQMSNEIRVVYPALGKYSLPQGMLYGSCPERENCGRCKV